MNVQTNLEIISYWFVQLIGKNPSGNMLAGLLQFMPNPSNPNFVPDIKNPAILHSIQEMVITIAMLPEFSVRG